MSSLLRPAISLSICHQPPRTTRGITVYLTWRTRENGSTVQCMVLLDAMRPVFHGKTVPVIIDTNDAWRYIVSDDKEIGDRAHAVANITEWIAFGYLPNNVHAILDAINENVTDLYKVPPKPKVDTYAIGEVTITDRLSGSIIKEDEVTNDV